MPKKGQKRLEFGVQNSEDTETFLSTALCFESSILPFIDGVRLRFLKKAFIFNI